MELRKPLILTIIAAAGGAAVARGWPVWASGPHVTLSAPPSPAVAEAGYDASKHVGYPVGTALRVGPTSADQFVAGRNAGAPRQGRPTSATASTRAVVYVAGEVLRPGIYALPAAGRDADAVHAAGGPTRAADLVAVNLAAPLEDGNEIIVPAKGSAAAQDAMAAATTPDPPLRRRRHRTHHRKHRPHGSTQQSAVGNADASSSLAGPVPLNAADATRLQTLPGIGPALAARIVAFRELNGPFASVDELLDVSGMTQSKLDALSPAISLR